jgi:hypothetical protein
MVNISIAMKGPSLPNPGAEASDPGEGLLTTLPTLDDERLAYDSQGLARETDPDELVNPNGWTAALLGGWTDPNEQFGTNIHSDTEGDDLWMALNQYNRYNGIRQEQADNWLTRAQNMRDWMVDHIETTVAADQNADHLYGWGLAQWATEQGPDSEALATINALRIDLNANTDVFANETPGVDSVFSQANAGRRWARWLRFAVALVEVDPMAANITFRDKVIDLILEDPNWDENWGMYWLSEGTTDADTRLGPGAYANGDRICILFQMGLVADAMWHAWRVLRDESDDRHFLMAQRLVAMADFWLSQSTDAGDRLHELNTGRNLNTEVVIRQGGSGTGNGNGAGGGQSGIYRIAPVNNLVFAYKFTGDETYLTEAWNLWKDWQAIAAGGVSGVVDHFADTYAPSASSPQWGNNKGELQYVYALFENGGEPVLVDYGPSWYTAATDKTWIDLADIGSAAFNTFDPLTQFTNWDVGNSLSGADYLISKIDSWNGAVTDGRTLILPNTGGHRGSGYNAVYQFDFTSENPRWHWYGTDSTLFDIPTHTGSPDATVSNWSAEENVGYYSDELPSSTHTYDHLAYDDVNRVVFQPYSAFVYSGANQTSSIQPVATSVKMAEQGLGGFYEAEDTYPDFPSKMGPGGAVEYANGKVWIFTTGASGSGSNRSFLSIDLAEKLYTIHNTAMGSIGNDTEGGAVDPDREIMIVHGDGDDLLVIDLSSGREGEFVEISDYDDGALPISNGGLGMTFEPVGQKFVAYGGGASIQIMPPPANYRNVDGSLNASASWAWSTVTNNGGGATPSVANPQGTHGRFRYISAIKALAVINQPSDAMYVYKVPENGL